MSDRRLMILGTQFELVRLVQRAKQRGYYTVVCDAYADGPARAYADADYVEDVREIDAIAEICRREHIDHIITSFSDIMFECMVRIADRADLPCYVSLDQLDAYRQKDVCKQICLQQGIAVPRFIRLKSDFHDSEIAGFRFPAVLKPTDSYGSRGMSIVYNPQEVREHFALSSEFSSTDEALLEELSQGQELNCMGFLMDGKVHLLSMSDRMCAPIDRYHIPVNYAQHYPSHLYDEAAEKVTDVLQRFANATGQKEGPICTQCFYDGQHIEICEMVGRFFGFEHELVTMYTGLDMEDLLLDLQYEPDRVRRTLQTHDAAGSKSAYGIYLTSVREGTVTDQHVLREIADMDGVVDAVLFYRDGQRCGYMGPAPYFARYYLQKGSDEENRQLEKQILDRASAADEHGEQLLFCPHITCQQPSRCS